MNIATMVAAVLAVTQFLKDILKDWGLNVAGGWAMLLSLLCSAGVVLYFQLSTGTPITWNSLWILIQVFALANGGKKLLNSIKPNVT